MATHPPVEPGTALLWFGLLAALALALFWPRRGLVARVVRSLRVTERVRAEDAIKHLLKEEEQGRAGTLESLAGILGTPRGRAVRLVEKLEERGLVRSGAAGLRLTDEGRGHALRVLRTHRLWERYLADRTGLPPAEWHAQAEEREHRLTANQTEDLAARMGHPLYDPHGDPIPTADGELPAQEGAPLTTLRAGDTATIVHLEDEPRTVYERLVAEGLSPQMHLRVVETRPDRIFLRTEAGALALTRVQAANVTVQPVEDTGEIEAPHRTLASLSDGASARVVHIAPGCQGPQRRRLLDLGVVPGTVVTAELTSAAGDPVAYRIRGALVALRRDQAAWIHVEPVAAGEGA